MPIKLVGLRKREYVRMLREWRREFSKLILDNCRDRWAGRRNLEQLISIVGEEAIARGRPVGGRLANISPWLPTEKPRPDSDLQPSKQDRMRMHALGVGW